MKQLTWIYWDTQSSWKLNTSRRSDSEIKCCMYYTTLCESTASNTWRCWWSSWVWLTWWRWRRWCCSETEQIFIQSHVFYFLFQTTTCIITFSFNIMVKDDLLHVNQIYWSCICICSVGGSDVKEPIHRIKTNLIWMSGNQETSHHRVTTTGGWTYTPPPKKKSVFTNCHLNSPDEWAPMMFVFWRSGDKNKTWTDSVSVLHELINNWSKTNRRALTWCCWHRVAT